MGGATKGLGFAVAAGEASIQGAACEVDIVISSRPAGVSDAIVGAGFTVAAYQVGFMVAANIAGFVDAAAKAGIGGAGSLPNLWWMLQMKWAFDGWYRWSRLCRVAHMM